MRRILVVGLGVLVLLVGACSSDSGDDTATSGGGTPDAGENPFSALTGGGGGTMTVDGEEIEITSAICQLDDVTYDVGTVSDPGYRVLLSRTNAENPNSIQILDPNFLQWFPDDQNLELTRDGGTFSAETATYWNNSDDRMIEASFRVECP